MEKITGRCPVCREEFADKRPTMNCTGCATPYHGECFNYNRGCGIYGCKGLVGEEPLLSSGGFILALESKVTELVRVFALFVTAVAIIYILIQPIALMHPRPNKVSPNEIVVWHGWFGEETVYRPGDDMGWPMRAEITRYKFSEDYPGVLNVLDYNRADKWHFRQQNRF